MHQDHHNASYVFMTFGESHFDSLYLHPYTFFFFAKENSRVKSAYKNHKSFDTRNP